MLLPNVARPSHAFLGIDGLQPMITPAAAVSSQLQRVYCCGLVCPWTLHLRAALCFSNFLPAVNIKHDALHTAHDIVYVCATSSMRLHSPLHLVSLCWWHPLTSPRSAQPANDGPLR